MEYRFEEMQPLMFVVYDVDNESPSLEDDDFLGQVEMTLGGVVSLGSVTQNLQHKDTSGEGKGDLGTITVSVVPARECVCDMCARVCEWAVCHMCSCVYARVCVQYVIHCTSYIN